MGAWAGVGDCQLPNHTIFSAGACTSYQSVCTVIGGQQDCATCSSGTVALGNCNGGFANSECEVQPNSFSYNPTVLAYSALDYCPPIIPGGDGTWVDDFECQAATTPSKANDFLGTGGMCEE